MRRLETRDELPSHGAGVRAVSLHTLRKTGASILESLGVSRAETQEALRHKRSTVTDCYVSVYMERRREHIELMAAAPNGDQPFPQHSPQSRLITANNG